MRKGVLFVTIVGLILISCTKKGDYTCTCTTTLQFFGQIADTISQSAFNDTNKDNALGKCDELNYSGTTCTLSEE